MFLVCTVFTTTRTTGSEATWYPSKYGDNIKWPIPLGDIKKYIMLVRKVIMDEDSGTIEHMGMEMPSMLKSRMRNIFVHHMNYIKIWRRFQICIAR